MAHKYVSLGGGCDVAMMLDALKLREQSLPFDWLWNLNGGFAAVNAILEGRFAQVSDAAHYELGHHPRLGEGQVLYKSFPAIMHLHSDPLRNAADHQTLVRRIARFKDLLRSKDHLHFIYYFSFGEEIMVEPDLTLEKLIAQNVAEAHRFLSFMSRKGHGKRVTLLLVLQTRPDLEETAQRMLERQCTGDERIQLAFTITRDDSSPELFSRWKHQWFDIITSKTNMPDDLIAETRSQFLG